jgi:hypothetical protein
MLGNLLLSTLIALKENAKKKIPIVFCMVLYWVIMSTEEAVKQSWWWLPLGCKQCDLLSKWLRRGKKI